MNGHIYNSICSCDSCGQEHYLRSIPSELLDPKASLGDKKKIGRKPRAPRAEKAPPIKGECGYMDPSWEADIIGFGWCENAARQILAVRSFRSEFRQSMRDQLVAWLDTPSEDRKFRSPLSPRQWECIQPFDPRSRYTMGRY